MGRYYTKVNEFDGDVHIGNIVIDSILLLIGLIFLLGSWGTVPAGYRGILLQFSAVQPGVKGEGLYFKIPMVQSVQDIEVRITKKEVAAGASSKDLQIVTSKIALNYHLDPLQVGRVWKDVGPAYEERIISPAVQEVVKATTAKYQADELVTKREKVSTEIKEGLISRLQRRGIMVDEFNILDFDFSKSFNDAIEAKVTAEQLKLQADMDLTRIAVEKEQVITAAQGKAEAIRIEGLAIKNSPQVTELRWIEKWDGKVPQYWGNATPFIGLNK